MKKYLLILAIGSFQTINAQNIGNLLKKATTIVEQSQTGLSSGDIAGGLKEALLKGAQTGTAKLSSPGGFLENAALGNKVAF
jgi:hypothetical protein